MRQIYSKSKEKPWLQCDLYETCPNFEFPKELTMTVEGADPLADPRADKRCTLDRYLLPS